MHYEIVELPARTIVGPTVRASNNSPEETAVIGQLWQRFMGEGLDRTIRGAHRALRLLRAVLRLRHER